MIKIKLYWSNTLNKWVTIPGDTEENEPAIYAEPVCSECGEPLSSELVDDGENACLDCQLIRF